MSITTLSGSKCNVRKEKEKKIIKAANSIYYESRFLISANRMSKNKHQNIAQTKPDKKFYSFECKTYNQYRPTYIMFIIESTYCITQW